MADTGVRKLGKHRGLDVVAEFSFDHLAKGLDWVSLNHELGQIAVLVPEQG